VIPADGDWILIVEDDEATRAIYERFLKGTTYKTVAVPTLAQARDVLRANRPLAVVLDILLPGEEDQTWRWLAETKSHDAPVPVIVVSATGDGRKALSLGADAYFDKPLARDALVAKLDEISGTRASDHVALIIDDDPAARYVIRRSVRGPMKFEEAADGPAGLAAAARMRPEVIFLDLSMPGMNGSEVLQRLAADPGTAGIPVVVVTSHELDDTLRTQLNAHARAIVQKKDLSIEVLARTLEAIQRGAAGP
jgi:CheY-like chemotaxis protein